MEAAQLELTANKPLLAAELLHRGENTVGEKLRGRFHTLRQQIGV